MKFIENIEIEKYDEFVEKNSYAHYTKLSGYAQTKKQQGFKPHYCAMVDKNEIIATVAIYEKTQFLTKFYYIQMGPCLDYNDQDLVGKFIQEIKNMAIKNKVAFVKMSLNVIRNENSNNLINQLNNLGFIHKGYTYGYEGSWDNRHTVVIDLQDEITTIKNNFTKVRKSKIKKHELYCVDTKVGTIDQLSVLCDFEKELGLLKNFKPHELSYFETLYNNFKDHLVFAIATVDFDKALEQLDLEINSKKYAKDIKALDSKKQSYQQILGFKNKYGNNYPIATGLFITINDYSWDLFLYNHKEFNFMYGTDAIHLFMMENMKQRGVKTYDMCGYSGNKDSSDPDYGLYLYKTSFGAQPLEFLGEFNLIIKPNKFKYFNKIYRLNRKIKRKIAGKLK